MMDEFQFILHPSSFQARGATTGRGGWPGGSAGAGRVGAGPTSHNFTSPGDSLVPPALTSRRPSGENATHSTHSRWAWRVTHSAPVAASQSLISPKAFQSPPHDA